MKTNRPLDSNLKPEYARHISIGNETRLDDIRKNSPAHRPFREAHIVMAGEDFLTDHFYAGTPCSKSHLIWFLVEGGITVDFGDGPNPLLPGEVAISPAIRPHWVQLTTPKAKGLWFHLHKTPRWEHLYEEGPCIRRASFLNELEWLMDHCLAELKSHESGAIQNALHYAGAIAVILGRELASKNGPGKSDHLGRKLDQFWAELIPELGSKWTVKQIAQALCISESHLHRICDQRYGIAPKGVLTRMRMDRAMDLLLSSPRKLDDIALEVGYTSAYAFSDAFERHVGQRPSFFRARQSIDCS